MKLPEPMSWDRAEARKGKFDGKFTPRRDDHRDLLPAVLRRPSAQAAECARCSPPRRKPRRRACAPASAAVPTFTTRAKTRMSPCSRAWRRGCAAAPTISPMPRPWRKAAGVSLTKLGDLFRDHAHLAPAAWLRRDAGASTRRRNCWPAATRWPKSASAPALNRNRCSTASSSTRCA